MTHYTLGTLEKNSIRDYVDNNVTFEDLKSFKTLQTKAVVFMTVLEHKYPTVFKTEYHNVYVAFTLAYCAKKAIDVSAITVCKYIRFYAEQKRNNTEELNDYGAFGDLFELLVRLAFIGNLTLVRSSSLHVKEQAKTDIVSNRYGKIEVGHNGKTWSKATVFNFMNGEFDSVVYGMFSAFDRQQIYSLCACGNIEQAVKYVKEYSCFWSDKNQYLADMDNLSRGKGLTIKAGCVQTVYNDSKYQAFNAAIEEKRFTTLSDILNK